MTEQQLLYVLGLGVVVFPSLLVAILGVTALIGRPLGEATIARVTDRAADIRRKIRPAIAGYLEKAGLTAPATGTDTDALAEAEAKGAGSGLGICAARPARKYAPRATSGYPAFTRRSARWSISGSPREPVSGCPPPSC